MASAIAPLSGYWKIFSPRGEPLEPQLSDEVLEALTSTGPTTKYWHWGAGNQAFAPCITVAIRCLRLDRFLSRHGCHL